MKYLSVCSGIEAATVAWHPLGWQPVAFGEIEKFPCQVLENHYPDTPNWGDMTKFKEWPDADVNVFVGGTPCQSFSVAGLRKGLDDPRGNLMLTYLAIAARYRPRWLVWENVPGVLSSNGGLDFASLLRGMGELGYGFAYRILDAQYFGVAQRRRRVFVVGYLGNWRPAAAVLFERHSLSGNPAPSREKREGVAAYAREGAASSRWPAEISSTLDTTFGTKQGLEDQHVNAGCPMFVPAEMTTVQTLRTRRPGEGGMSHDHEHLVPTLSPALNTCSGANHAPDTKAYVVQPIALAENTIGRKPENGGNHDGFTENGPMYTLNATGVHGVAQPIAYNIASGKGALKDDIHVTDADATKTLDAFGSNPAMHQGGAAIVQPIAFAQNQRDEVRIMAQAGALAAEPGMKQQTYIAQPIAFSGQMSNPQTDVDMTQTLQAKNPMAVAFSGDIARTLQARHDSSPCADRGMDVVAQAMAVRRLTPVECERLQGFPDNYTDIKPKGKATPDGPRYKALGNSMAVPVMAWIGKRIQEVDAICQTQKQ